MFAGLNGKALAILRDGHALDLLHDEVGGRIFAAIEQARDIGMHQAGQNLPLLTETPTGLRSVDKIVAEGFDGDVVGVDLVVAHSLIDGAHAAVPEHGSHAIGPEPAADCRPAGLGVLLRQRLSGGHGIADSVGWRGISAEHAVDFAAQFGVAGTFAIEERGAGLRGEVRRSFK